MQPSGHTRFYTTLTDATTADADGVAFTANYAVFSTNVDGETRIYQTGRYIDRVRKIDDIWKFVEKRAVFDTSRVQTLLALPI